MLKLFSTKDFQQKSLSLEMFNSILERASEEKNKHRMYSLKWCFSRWNLGSNVWFIGNQVIRLYDELQ